VFEGVLSFYAELTGWCGVLQVVKEPPGVIEERAIDMARQRNALMAQGGHRAVEEMKRRSDEVR